MSKKQETTISDTVMEQIKHGNVTMRSKSYFVVLAIISSVAAIFTAIILAYLLSILTFWLRIQTADTYAWGARANLSEAINSFPWWALLLAMIMLVVTVWLIKRQGRMYRHRTSVIILAIFAVSLLLGVSMSYLGLYDTHGSGQRPNSNGIQRNSGGQRNSQ